MAASRRSASSSLFCFPDSAKIRRPRRTCPIAASTCVGVRVLLVFECRWFSMPWRKVIHLNDMTHDTYRRDNITKG